jgi:hypothetical protein
MKRIILDTQGIGLTRAVGQSTLSNQFQKGSQKLISQASVSQLPSNLHML